MNCAHCDQPIIPGQQLPVVLEWGKKDRDAPQHLGRPIQKAVHQACDLKMRGKPERPIAKLAGVEPAAPKSQVHKEPSERQQKSESMGHKFIYRLVDSNPRKEGTWGWKSFELVKDGMTVDEYLKAGGRKNDLQWDVDHKFVELTNEEKANAKQVISSSKKEDRHAAQPKKQNAVPPKKVGAHVQAPAKGSKVAKKKGKK